MDQLRQKLNKLRQQIKIEQLKGHRARYPNSVKDTVRSLYQGGVGIISLSDETGIARSSLQRWVLACEPDNMVRNFRSMSVHDCEVFELSFPSGIVIRGLNINHIKELVDYACAS